MKILLVPVDFTPATGNAVTFAAAWSKQYEYTHIILLKTFYNLADHIVVSAEYTHFNNDYMAQERSETMDKMNELADGLRLLVGVGITVITATSELPLLRAIIEIVEDEKPEMILLGSNSYAPGNSLVTENIISIAKASPVRLLIVPMAYSYQPVQVALVPFDFNTLDTLDKLRHLHTSPLWSQVKLLALNVDPKKRYQAPEAFMQTENKLHEYLQDFDHEIYYSDERNIINGIINFTGTHAVQLIIAMPGRHSFLYSLTHSSISEAIYRNATVPVMILK